MVLVGSISIDHSSFSLSGNRTSDD